MLTRLRDLTRSKEIRLVTYVSGLYVSFVYWGYLQEKITSTEYIGNDDNLILKWQYPFALNVFMALATYVVASIGDMFCYSTPNVPLFAFMKPALTCAMASPIGYIALEYISFPLVVLTKSSKPVPVMLVGLLFYQRKYPWYKYVSVLLLCSGIALFSFRKSGGKIVDVYSQVIGIVLVCVNLFLDGYTNNEQDEIFKKYQATSLQMMKYVNFWQIFYLLAYLSVGYLFYGNESELWNAFTVFVSSPALRFDVLMFCICASVGQVIIFAVMKEFGSLLWVTVSITRKLVTIVVSVVMFNHSIGIWQWIGVASVFSGMSLEVFMSYRSKNSVKTKDKQS